MNQKDQRAKKSAIRKEIKERTQAELNRRKKEIKSRIKREDISIEEKRTKYRHEVHEEKLRLMQRAKEEFIARKRMLGFSPEEELSAISEERRRAHARPASYEEERIDLEVGPADRFQILEEESEILGPGKYHSPEQRFIYSDGDESERRRYEAPISESDVEPFGKEVPEKAVADENGLEFEGLTETNGLFYYVFNLFLHPVRALGEFDEYAGLVKVALLYGVSLLPFILWGMMIKYVSDHISIEKVGEVMASIALFQVHPILIVSNEILKLLLYSLCIAGVSRIMGNKAGFLTLTSYFAFVRAVTSLVVYPLVFAALFGAVANVAQPQIALLLVGVATVLLVVRIIWTFVLNMIVLISGCGYGLAISFVLSLVASFVSWIVTHIAVNEFGIYLF